MAVGLSMWWARNEECGMRKGMTRFEMLVGRIHYLENRFGKGSTVSNQLTAEYLAPFTDPQLFLSEYQLRLPAKEKFTEFLKKENEGLHAPASAKGAKHAKKRKTRALK